MPSKQIKTEEDYAKYLEYVKELMMRNEEDLSIEEELLLDSFVAMIEEYEAIHYPIE